MIEQSEVMHFEKKSDHIKIVTKDAEYKAHKLLITVGAYVKELLPELTKLFTVSQQSLFWIKPDEQYKSLYTMGNFPCWNLELPDNLGPIYGFPYLDNSIVKQEGLKLAHHYPGKNIHPLDKTKEAPEADKAFIEKAIQQYFLAHGWEIVKSCTCLYTNTKDYNFIIDYLKGYENQVVLAAGFSGHGFKFSAGLGELLVDIVLEQRKDPALEFLSMKP